MSIKKYTKYICEYCTVYNFAFTKTKTKLKQLEVLCAPYINMSNQVKNKFYLCSTGLASRDFKLTPTALRR